MNVNYRYRLLKPGKVRFFACALLSSVSCLHPLLANAEHHETVTAQNFQSEIADEYTEVACSDTPLHAPDKDDDVCYKYDSGKLASTQGRTRIDKRIGAINHVRQARLLQTSDAVIVSVYHLRMQTAEMLKHRRLKLPDLLAVFKPTMSLRVLDRQSALPQLDIKLTALTSSTNGDRCAGASRQINKRRYLFAHTCGNDNDDTLRAATLRAIRSLGYSQLQ